MTILFKNNAKTTLSAGITNVATSIPVAAGYGALFPAPSGSDFFYATLTDVSNNIEIVKVTSRSTDTMTVVRGQEGTTARAYLTGDKFQLRITAASLTAFVQLTATQTLTNKTIDTAGPNTVKVNGNTLAASAGTATVTIPNSTDTLVGKATTDTLTNKTIDTAGPNTIKVNGNILAASAGTATVTIPNTTSTLVGRATTDTLTNKTIDTAGPNTIKVNGNTLAASAGTATVTVPNATDTLVGKATTDTLTNKTIDTAGSNTVKVNGNALAASAGTATVTLPNSTDTLVGRATTDTLTNKTLTSPVINGTLTGSILNTLLTENGYMEFAGVIFQWGRYAGGSASPTITFPLAFPTACFAVVPVAVGGGSFTTNSASTSVHSVALRGTPSTTQFQAWCSWEQETADVFISSTDTLFHWIAVGN